MKAVVLTVAVLLSLGAGVARASGASEAPSVEQSTQWAAWGGTIGVRWMDSVLGDMGVTIQPATQKLPVGSARLTDGLNGILKGSNSERFELRRSGSIEFRSEGGSFAGFTGGSLQARGGYVLSLADGSSVDLADFRLRPKAGKPLQLDVISRDGKAWFYIDRLMYEITRNNQVLAIYTADMRLSREFAERVGQPHMADHPIGDFEILTELVGQGSKQVNLPNDDPNPSHWHGDPVPGQPAGTIFQADLFMEAFTINRVRSEGTSGPGGSGRIVFAPSSSLINNVNSGTAAVSVRNQGALGTSTALWTADIPWREKFSGTRAPYANDQHPYLIWNMYRINADGGIEQIGRSGVKHAWFTSNGGCAPGERHGSANLGRSCFDIYSMSNNDANKDLSFRSEIIPATGQWGRCGSLFDPDCSGANTNPAPADDQFVRRLVVNESQLSNTVNPGATFLFDSWYLARQDINIYNSMATLTGTPTFTSDAWNFSDRANYKLGSITDRWVENLPAATQALNTELAVGEGHTKLAVRVTALGNGQWRYHYAVHNLDFARAVTSGAEPNLRVLSNKGFNRFSVPLPAGVNVISNAFSDGDLITTNQWSFSSAANALTWTAPTGGSLDWGTLYLFSVVLNAAPHAGITSLNVAQAGTPISYNVAALVPAIGDVIYRDGFDSTP